MKIIVGFILLSFVACSPVVSNLKPLELTYGIDDFKEIENVYLEGEVIAVNPTPEFKNQLVKIFFRKELTPDNTLDFLLSLDLGINAHLEQEFYMVINQDKYNLAFDSIEYMIADFEEVNTYDDGTQVTKWKEKQVNADFQIPENLKNKIITADQVIIRYYIDNAPYQITFGESPQSQMKKRMKGYDQVYNGPTKEIQLQRLKTFMMMNTKTDYVNYWRLNH